MTSKDQYDLQWIRKTLAKPTPKAVQENHRWRKVTEDRRNVKVPSHYVDDIPEIGIYIGGLIIR